MAGRSRATSTPAAEGIDPAAIDSLIADIEAGRYGLLDHFLLIRHGRVVADRRYAHDYDSIAAAYDTTNHQYNYDQPRLAPLLPGFRPPHASVRHEERDLGGPRDRDRREPPSGGGSPGHALLRGGPAGHDRPPPGGAHAPGSAHDEERDRVGTAARDLVVVFNGWNIHATPERSTYRALQERILPAIRP